MTGRAGMLLSVVNAADLSLISAFVSFVRLSLPILGVGAVARPSRVHAPWRRGMPGALRAAVLIAAFASLHGCAFGPKAIERSHGKYGAAVQRVEEEQFLKNIVRLRYCETPRNLDVAAIAAQYELSAGAEARPFFGTEASGDIFRSFSRILPFAGVSGANRPTISLDPQDDGSSVRQFMTPISSDTMVFLFQSGWPVSSVLRIWADRLNGVPNWVPHDSTDNDSPPDYQRFRRAAELLQIAKAREYGSVHVADRLTELSDPLPASAVNAAAVAQAAKDGFEYRRKGDDWVLVKREPRIVLQVTPAGRDSPELTELAALLHMKPGQDQYDVLVASGILDPAKTDSAPSASMRVTPRSTIQAMFFLAHGVEVPPEHAACGLVHLPADAAAPLDATSGVFRVHCCTGHKHLPPACAYCAVWYRDHWFYIDDRDQESKSTLLLMLQLRKLDFQRQRIGNVPALTLQVGR